jgi:hypothetical protein
MPLAYERNDDERRIRLTASGHVTTDDWQAALNRQMADNAWEFGTLLDARHSSVATPTPDELRASAEYLRVLVHTNGQRGPFAIVVDRPVLFGMARMYTALADEVELAAEVFDEIAQAEAWLDFVLRARTAR